jgi:hypothetical protein
MKWTAKLMIQQIVIFCGLVDCFYYFLPSVILRKKPKITPKKPIYIESNFMSKRVTLHFTAKTGKGQSV